MTLLGGILGAAVAVTVLAMGLLWLTRDET